ncbi:MAG: cupin domain-containing protein [Gemmatimonadaceae bacterium]
MKVMDVPAAAAAAVSANPMRPATAALHDVAAVRLVVFRIEPGQQVAPHTNPGTVLLTVVSGRGAISGDGETHEVGVGSLVAYSPGELHAMRAGEEPFVVLATIIPPA